MRNIARIAGLVVMLLSCVPLAHAQTPNGAADAAAIQGAITRQLEAMNRDDGGAAFAIASPAIQAMFTDVATFIGMVRRQYPQVYHSRSHRFLKLSQDDGKLIQRVLIESEAGTVVARYEMVQIDGVWRINGCMLEARESA